MKQAGRGGVDPVVMTALMKRPIVLALLAVVAAVAVYLLVIRDDGGAKASDERTGAGEAARPDRQDAPRTRPPVRNDAPDRRGAAVGDGPGYTEEYVGGTRVRDHRTDPDDKIVRPPLPHRSDAKVDPTVTSQVMRAVRPVVLECMRNVPDSAYADRPVVVTRTVISIDDQGKLAVAELDPRVNDIDEAAVEPALECIRAAASTLSVQVDHGAVPTATLSFTIRPLDYR